MIKVIKLIVLIECVSGIVELMTRLKGDGYVLMAKVFALRDDTLRRLIRMRLVVLSCWSLIFYALRPGDGRDAAAFFF